VRQATKLVGHDTASPFDFNPPAAVEMKTAFQSFIRGLRDLNVAGRPVSLTGGDADGVSPEVVGKLLAADDACHDRAGADSDADLN